MPTQIDGKGNQTSQIKGGNGLVVQHDQTVIRKEMVRTTTVIVQMQVSQTREAADKISPTAEATMAVMEDGHAESPFQWSSSNLVRQPLKKTRKSNILALKTCCLCVFPLSLILFAGDKMKMNQVHPRQLAGIQKLV
eukprot:3191594-Ditylum_brightwellii.AAC.1